MNFGQPVCRQIANVEIHQHHAMMAPAIAHNQGHPGTPAQNRFYRQEKNAFWFTKEDIAVFWNAMNAPTDPLRYVIVILGSHVRPEQIPPCNEEDVDPNNFLAWPEGSQTVILAGSNDDPRYYDAEKTILQVTAVGPYREYPSQGYIRTINP